MARFKLSAVEDLFPNKAKEMQEKEKEINYGHMFQIPADKKKKIVKYFSDCVEECKRQRIGIIENKKRAIMNYEGIKEGNGPWAGSSNVSTMITTIAADLMQSKLFPMVWNPDLLHFVGREKHDDMVAENNKVLMQWALTKDMEDTQDKAYEGLWRLVVEGGIQVKVSWEVYYPFVTRAIPEKVDSRGEIQYKIQYDQVKRERPRWDFKDLDRVYFPVNAGNVREAEYIIEEAYFTYPQILEMKEKGLLAPDFDVTVLKQKLDQMLDPKSIQETRNQALGVTQYVDRVDSYPIKTYEGCIKYDINDDRLREECIFITFPDLELYASGKPLHCVSKIGARPWVIKGFLGRPNTMLGKGVPEIVYHLHNEMDAIHNQRIDAGNMVIAPFFFYRPASGFEPKNIAVRPATGIPVDDPKRDVFFPDYNAGRLSVSFQEEQLIMQLIQMVTNVSDPMLGRELANRPTARGTLAVISQSDQRFTPLAMRVVKVFSDLITKTRRMYEENLDPSIAQRVLGTSGKQHWLRLSPEMIAGDYDAYMDVDLSTQNQALESQVDQLLYSSMVNDPYVNQNPAYAWELRANYLKAMGKKNVEKIIGPKPDYQMSPGDIDDENMSMLQEQEVQINENDDDLAHINSHAEFKRRMAKTLTPQALALLTSHLMEHRFRYQMKLQDLALMGGQNAAGQGNAGASGALNAPRMGTFQGPRVEGGQPGGPGAGAEISAPAAQ